MHQVVSSRASDDTAKALMLSRCCILYVRELQVRRRGLYPRPSTICSRRYLPRDGKTVRVKILGDGIGLETRKVRRRKSRQLEDSRRQMFQREREDIGQYLPRDVDGPATCLARLRPVALTTAMSGSLPPLTFSKHPKSIFATLEILYVHFAIKRFCMRLRIHLFTVTSTVRPQYFGSVKELA